jgi:hypothetical protein
MPLDRPQATKLPKAAPTQPGICRGSTKCVPLDIVLSCVYDKTKLFWVFTSRTIYLTKTDMHNLFLLLCYFLFFVLVTNKHDTCSCWMNIIIHVVDFFIIQNMSYSLWSRQEWSTEASWKVAIKQTEQGKTSDAKSWLGQNFRELNMALALMFSFFLDLF